MTLHKNSSSFQRTWITICKGIDANMLKTTPNGITTIPIIENEQYVVILEKPIILYQHGDLGGDVFREQDHLL